MPTNWTASSFIQEKNKATLQALKDKVAASKNMSTWNSAPTEADQISAYKTKAIDVMNKAKEKRAQEAAAWKTQNVDANWKPIISPSFTPVFWDTPQTNPDQISVSQPWANQTPAPQPWTTWLQGLDKWNTQLNSIESINALQAKIDATTDPTEKAKLLAEKDKMLNENKQDITKAWKDIKKSDILSEWAVTETQAANLLGSRLAPINEAITNFTNAITANQALIQVNDKALEREFQAQQAEIQRKFTAEQNDYAKTIQQLKDNKATDIEIAKNEAAAIEKLTTRKDLIRTELNAAIDKVESSEFWKRYESAKIWLTTILSLWFQTDPNWNPILDSEWRPKYKENLWKNDVINIAVNLKKAYDWSQVTPWEQNQLLAAMASLLWTSIDNASSFMWDESKITQAMNWLVWFDSQEFRQQIVWKAFAQVRWNYIQSVKNYNEQFFNAVQRIDQSVYWDKDMQKLVDDLQANTLKNVPTLVPMKADGSLDMSVLEQKAGKSDTYDTTALKTEVNKIDSPKGMNDPIYIWKILDAFESWRISRDDFRKEFLKATWKKPEEVQLMTNKAEVGIAVKKYLDKKNFDREWFRKEIRRIRSSLSPAWRIWLPTDSDVEDLINQRLS